MSPGGKSGLEVAGAGDTEHWGPTAGITGQSILPNQEKQRHLSGSQRLLDQLLAQQINYKSVQKFNVDVSGIVSPHSAVTTPKPRTSQTRNRPMSKASTQDSNLNQIKTKMMYYEVAVKKKFRPMYSNA